MSAGQLNVLLVDDESGTLRLLSQWLEGAGFSVTTASDGCQAAVAIEAACPHILLADWMMPGMDGMDLCRWLRRQETPHYVYTILFSGRSGDDDMVRGLEAGADDFLKKPVVHGELLARLQAATRVLDWEQRLRELAAADVLTGLANQRTLYECMEREWGRAKRHHYPLSCVMLDIDFFKRVNDTLGHAAGDTVIRRVATMLRENCRTSDVVSRYGGEEFCVLLPETDERNAVLWADRVRRALAATKIPVGGKEISVTASFGVAQRLDDTQSPETLVDLADQALLVAKRSGRDRVVGFQSIGQSSQLQSAAEGAAALFNHLPARTVMTTIVASLQQDEPVGRAANHFLRFRFSSAPVVDERGKLVGMLSEKDVMAIMLMPNWWSHKIKDVMKTNVVYYEEDTPALSIFEFLCRVSMRSVVIVNDGRPTGILSRGSLLRWFTNSQRNETFAGGEEPSSARGAELAPRLSAIGPRESLLLTARALSTEAAALELRLRSDDDDLVPCLVGGASRMQELVNDLLANSRYANVHDEWSGDEPNASFAGAHDMQTQRGLVGLVGNLHQVGSLDA